MRIDVPGTGIAFIIPVSSIGGKRALQFLTEHQTFALKEESTLKDTCHELLLVIANQGHTGSIMDAARAAGAGGGTVIHAKGTGMEGAAHFMGVELVNEKELVLIVSRTTLKNQIMQAIMQGAGPKREHRVLLARDRYGGSAAAGRGVTVSPSQALRASSPKGGALGSHINPAVLMGSNRIGWIFLKFSCIIRIVWEVLL